MSEIAVGTVGNNAAGFAHFMDTIVMRRFIFQSLQSEHPQCETRVVACTGVEGARRMRRGRRRNTGRGDKATALHCQRREAINN